MPESLRHTLFAEVSPQEKQRLRELLSCVATVDDAIVNFGPPDSDQPQGEGVREPTASGDLLPINWFRVLTYSSLSDTVIVRLVVLENGTVRPSFVGKFIGDANADA